MERRYRIADAHEKPMMALGSTHRHFMGVGGQIPPLLKIDVDSSRQRQFQL
ncbi:MAG: hypothetical protein ABI162_01005 [Luteolibacter sp.]